jgi:hypothetical protein
MSPMLGTDMVAVDDRSCTGSELSTRRVNNVEAGKMTMVRQVHEVWRTGREHLGKARDILKTRETWGLELSACDAD